MQDDKQNNAAAPTEHTNSQAFDTFLLLHLLVYALAIVVVALDFLVWRPN